MRCFVDAAEYAVAIVPVTREGLDQWLDKATGPQARWVREHDFEASPARHLVIPDEDGGIGTVLVAMTDHARTYTLGDLPRALPKGTVCHLEGHFETGPANALALGWALGCYRFDRYRKDESETPKLISPATATMDRVIAMAEAIHLGRDLINTPAEDMGPAELTGAVADLGDRFGADVRLLEGNELLEHNYPAIHAVGRASHREPRLADLVWGDPGAPKVTLVGKGVVFDSGGLDLKPAAGMKMMKKDMGGAASAITLASMIMALNLPVRLRLLIPAVENSVAGNAYRPLDVITTRSGLTIEIGNTDAEGRVILCDALAEAVTEKPDLLVDMATLTGAARVALGPDVPVFFSNDDDLATAIHEAAERTEDDVWRLPLWPGYRKMLDSDVADLSTTGSGPGAGAITAALFLERFVRDSISWAHFDIMGWNLNGKPGRPKGGEVMAVRALLDMIERRFGS
ncbi:MAG: leucyl aminopeptidase [Rhodospirillaceae bacterium]|nr:leucyl aminopeptidase [Rhodospirillaceae bacterium]|tara:strand:+ start:5953 stop:7329 length:1377 start_codon:yes stop_codon:yes gene_type:complete